MCSEKLDDFQKTILYLNHNFFEYDKAIERQFRSMGYEVLSFKYVRLSNWFENRWMEKTGKDAYALACHRCQKAILKKLQKEKYDVDVVFVTAGHMLEKETLMKLREMYPKARFIWYLWDNIVSVSNYEENHVYFDKILSFDELEARERDISFLPDFYVYERTNTKKIFDLAYIGTYRKERMDIIKRLLQDNALQNEFIYLYQKRNYGIADRLYQLYAWVFQKTKKDEEKYFFSKMLNYDEVIDIMAQSKVVLDICYSTQTGLSMRPFEAMATGSKLITTNKSIVKYDFYNPDNIWVLDKEKDFFIPEEFWKTEYVEVPDSILEKYSIRAWSKCIEKYFKTEVLICD